jgi:hypothetical protein
MKRILKSQKGNQAWYAHKHDRREKVVENAKHKNLAFNVSTNLLLLELHKVLLKNMFIAWW